jgi:subtilisin family serine protease
MIKRDRIPIIAGAVLTVLLVAGLADEPLVQERIPNDPYFYSKGSWKQTYLDQWGHWKVGLSPMGTGKSAWDIETGESNPVLVAFIDSGLDYIHPEIARRNVWINRKEISGNGIDDDDNGYVDDLIGWNFIDKNNNPWDNDGHGTFTAGMVAARTNNGEGIVGINRAVKIMPLRALNFLGRGSVSHIVEAMVYAADNGARIINVSIEQLEHEKSRALQWAVDHAHKKGVLIVVASGNQGRDTATISPSGLKRELTVAATDTQDKRMGFSNWGKFIRIAAPGEDILSLRARRTDLLAMAGSKEYKPGRAFLGSDARYYHTTGTSFAAPFVTGVASLILAKNPRLTNVQVERMLLMSADDVETPGWDQLTGYGRLNARKALEADPDYHLYAEVHKVAPGREGGRTVVQVFGTIMGSHLGNYHLEVAQGENPTTWRKAGKVVGGQVEDGLIATFSQADFGSAGKWTIRLVAQDTKGKQRESRGTLTIK